MVVLMKNDGSKQPLVQLNNDNSIEPVVAADILNLIFGENPTLNRLMVMQSFTYTNIVTNATTVVKPSGPGMLHGITINNPSAFTVAALTITIYDNTAASGSLIGTMVIPVDVTAKPYTIPLDVSFTTGLTIVTSGPTVPANLTISSL